MTAIVTATGILEVLRRCAYPLFCGGQGRDQFLHPRCAVSLHLVADMDIGFQRERRSIVTEVGLHRPDVVAVLQRDRRERVAQGVEGVVAHAAIFQHALQMFVDSATVERPAEIVGKNKIEVIVP